MAAGTDDAEIAAAADEEAAAPEPAAEAVSQQDKQRTEADEVFCIYDEIDASDSGAVTHIAITLPGASKHGPGPVLVCPPKQLSLAAQS